VPKLIYDLRKFNFTNRVIPIWNSLSDHVVYAETVNTFKNRLDRFWFNQDVLLWLQSRSPWHQEPHYCNVVPVFYALYTSYYGCISQIKRPLEACFCLLHVMWWWSQ